MTLVVDASVAIKWLVSGVLVQQAARAADRRLFERTRDTAWAERLQWLGAFAG